jgi:hypothetical protein
MTAMIPGAQPGDCSSLAADDTSLNAGSKVLYPLETAGDGSPSATVRRTWWRVQLFYEGVAVNQQL